MLRSAARSCKSPTVLRPSSPPPWIKERRVESEMKDADGWSHKVDETEQKMVDGEIEGRGELGRRTHGAFLSHRPEVSELSAILPCLLCERSPVSDGISNSLINQELCYVTLPLPLTHRREKPPNLFFPFLCCSTQGLYYCVHPPLNH